MLAPFRLSKKLVATVVVSLGVLGTVLSANWPKTNPRVFMTKEEIAREMGLSLEENQFLTVCMNRAPRQDKGHTEFSDQDWKKLTTLVERPQSSAAIYQCLQFLPHSKHRACSGPASLDSY